MIGFQQEPIVPDPLWEETDNRPGRESYEEIEED
jgi:hypothetical protein